MDDWKKDLAPELKDSPTLKDVKDVASLAKQFVDAQAMIGRSVRMPSKEAGDEDRKAFRTRVLEVGKDYGITALPDAGEDDTPFWNQLGRPEKPEAYAYDEAKTQGLPVTKEEIDGLRAIAHKAKMTPGQFKSFVGEFMDARRPVVMEMLGKREAGYKELKTAWGEKYDGNKSAVGKMLAEYKAPAAVQQAFKDDVMDADSLSWLHDVLSAFGGETLEIRSQKGGSGGKMNQVELLEQVSEVEKRLDKMVVSDPQYQGLLERRVQLLERAYPA
jgi:hypothetical protein